jgi:hypothetical protein
MTQAAVVDIGYVAAEPRDNDAALAKIPTATHFASSIGPRHLSFTALLVDKSYTYMNGGRRCWVRASELKAEKRHICGLTCSHV